MIPMLLMITGTLPALVTVTVWAELIVPTSWLRNVNAVGMTVATGIVPVPVSATVSVGASGSLVLITMLAARAPITVGVNVTLTAQFAPAAMPAPPIGQVLVWAKSSVFVPAVAILLMRSAAVPELYTVTNCAALVVLSAWFPNTREVGVAVAAGTIPVPVMGTDRVGLSGSLLTIASDAVRNPEAMGMNDTLIVQVAPVASVVLQPDTTAKSVFVPAEAIDVIVRSAVPVLDRATVWVALIVLTSWFPNARVAGATPAAGATPVPESVTVRVGCTGSLLPMESDAARGPPAIGLNATLIVQLVLVAGEIGDGSVALQVVAVIRKSAAPVPVIEVVILASGRLPVFESVTVWDVLTVFRTWFANVNDRGCTLATGAVPVPVIVTVRSG